MPDAPLVLVKGAGDFASGIIHRLHRAGFLVVATELERPLAVRRRACFSEAVYEGRFTVEGVTAVRCSPGQIDEGLDKGQVALLVDPETEILRLRKFDFSVDARSAKRNLGTNIDEAPVVIAIGPGFWAGRDCHAVVETLPGAGLGRVILKGPAAANSGEPSPLEGENGPCSPEYMRSLVIRAPRKGTFLLAKDIGSEVKSGDRLGNIGGSDVLAGADGILRGIIRDGTPVKKGVKLGDIDPSMNRVHLDSISEKSRAIAGGVLEAVMMLGIAGFRAGGNDLRTGRRRA
jgi:xanthine dehydrogenase accessory factor